MHYMETRLKAEKAKRLLLSGKYTKREIAKKLNVSYMTVFRWLKIAGLPEVPVR